MIYRVLATAAALVLAGCESAGDVDVAEAATPYPRAEQPADCPTEGAALQVLGSGGPIAEGSRAGTSYLLWIDGEPRLLIDAGAGSFLRFGEAGGRLESLDAILITHLHADHAGDLAGIFNTGGFEGRTRPLPVIGPDGTDRFPATGEFLARLLAKDRGAYGYNGGYLDGTEDKPLLEPRAIATEGGEGEPVVIELGDGLTIEAIPVMHGPVPALGYAITAGETTFVITGDQNAFSEGFASHLAGSRPAILFAHHVINGEPGQPRGLHRTPEEIGVLAGGIEPERLVLTHNMERSLAPIEASLGAIGTSYDGPVSVADDLDCYAP